jgi:flotillin
MDMSTASLTMVLLVSGSVLAALFATIFLIKRFLHICSPNEILIFSGRNHTTADGRTVGFRVIHGGRVFRVPILESVERMDIGPEVREQRHRALPGARP